MRARNSDTQIKADKRRRRRTATAVTALVIVLAAVWTLGLINFADGIPRAVSDAETRTEAIVVLTGGSERLSTGLRLLRDDKAERVFVSGVFPGVEIGELIRLAGPGSAGGGARIEAGHGARNTAGNAIETASWMRQHGYRTLRLVTGSYHMPRSLLEFRHALPEATIIPHPVFPDRVKQARWWQERGTAALIVGEYNKYLLSAVSGWAARAIEAVAGQGKPE